MISVRSLPRREGYVSVHCKS